MPEAIKRIAIVGRGRVGAGLGLSWSKAGATVTLLARSPGAKSGLQEAVGPGAWAATLHASPWVVVAVPDAAINPAAQAIADLEVVSNAHVVLHTSGLLDQRALDPLAASGASLGSLHPLMAIANAREAPVRLRGAAAGIDGEGAALAVAARLASLSGMEPVRIPAQARPAYHAAAAMVSNYTVALYGAAQQAAIQGGLPPDLAARIYLPLLRGTVDNLARAGPVEALTGAIRRGDAHTVACHLDALGDEALRRLYVDLGWVTSGHREDRRPRAGACIGNRGGAGADLALIDDADAARHHEGERVGGKACVGSHMRQCDRAHSAAAFCDFEPSGQGVIPVEPDNRLTEWQF